MGVSHSRPPRRGSESLGDLRRTQLTNRSLGRVQLAGQPTPKPSNLQSKVLSIRAQGSPPNQECPNPNLTPTQLSPSASNFHHARRKVHQPPHSVQPSNSPIPEQHPNSPTPEQHSNSPTPEQRSDSPTPKQHSQHTKHSSDPDQPPQSSSNSPPTTCQSSTNSPPTATCQTASNLTRPLYHKPTSKPSSSPTGYPSC